MELFPDTKVILTHRDTKEWYKSIHGTIYRMLTGMKADRSSGQAQMAQRIVMEEGFQGRLGEEDYAIDVFKKRLAEVKATVPKECLLVVE